MARIGGTTSGRVYEVGGVPTETTNPEIELGYNVAGDIVRIRKTINGVTYEKTVTNADTTVVSTKTFSIWSAI